MNRRVETVTETSVKVFEPRYVLHVHDKIGNVFLIPYPNITEGGKAKANSHQIAFGVALQVIGVLEADPVGFEFAIMGRKTILDDRFLMLPPVWNAAISAVDFHEAVQIVAGRPTVKLPPLDGEDDVIDCRKKQLEPETAAAMPVGDDAPNFAQPRVQTGGFKEVRRVLPGDIFPPF